MVKIMNKRGVTILELLISISLISIIIILLLKLIFSLDNINNSKDYASQDEIERTTIIKNIESDFLEFNLTGLNIRENDDNLIISFSYGKDLIVKENSLVYNDEEYVLNSKNAKYDLCIDYSYKVLDSDYYLININIPVLIQENNNTTHDDITLTYVGLITDNIDYIDNFSCSK